jgi:hypothetical protein
MAHRRWGLDQLCWVRAWWLACGLVGCQPPITIAEVNRIKVCTTNHRDVKQMFGTPSRVGRTGQLVLWTYNNDTGEGPLLVAFANDIVVDYVYNAPGLIELRDRCHSR